MDEEDADVEWAWRPTVAVHETITAAIAFALGVPVDFTNPEGVARLRHVVGFVAGSIGIEVDWPTDADGNPAPLTAEGN